VSLDVPYPADYGGAYAIFYKLRSLAEKGIKIHLHCFEYGRGQQKELNKYCEKVYYYPRNEGPKGFSFKIPYIVSSRNNIDLWNRLQKDKYPVLLEGLHCSYGIYADLLKDRNIVLYLHNVEHEYYKQLSKWESSLVKKTYFHHESRLLEKYEKQLANRYTIVTLTEKDKLTYKRKFGANQIFHLPLFVNEGSVQSLTGNGNYALYHGNLSVAENEKAAAWLLQKVFNDIDIPFVIAGKNPPERLIKLSHKKTNTCIVANPNQIEMDDLIKKAQLHVMPSFTNSGIKLKLINALFNGRHVIANDAMTEGTGLESLCHMANNAALMKYHVYRLFQTPFSLEDINKRTALLSRMFDRDKNTDILIRLLFE
jgi:glycosyltransferase involved in cell wall biosynthesis